eukprot:1904522-Lingulodinium_polyedra.AAC.1
MGISVGAGVYCQHEQACARAYLVLRCSECQRGFAQLSGTRQQEVDLQPKHGHVEGEQPSSWAERQQ